MATALLVLDMLDDFIAGKLANPAAEQVIEPIGALAGVARSRGDWVVVYGSDAHQARDLELAVFGEHAMAGSSGARVTGGHTSYDAFARGIELAMVADATAVYQPFAADGYQQAQSRALNYLRTYYGADVTDAPR